MVIFHSYVSLPEGTWWITIYPQRPTPKALSLAAKPMYVSNSFPSAFLLLPSTRFSETNGPFLLIQGGPGFVGLGAYALRVDHSWNPVTHRSLLFGVLRLQQPLLPHFLLPPASKAGGLSMLIRCREMRILSHWWSCGTQYKKNPQSLQHRHIEKTRSWFVDSSQSLYQTWIHTWYVYYLYIIIYTHIWVFP